MFVDENFYSILKAFKKLININNYRIVSSNKIYRNTTIQFTIKNFTISVNTSLFTNVYTFAYASYT